MAPNVGIKGDHNRAAVEGRPLNDLLGLGWPTDIQFTVLSHTIS
jgi:hypothetical protein